MTDPFICRISFYVNTSATPDRRQPAPNTVFEHRVQAMQLLADAYRHHDAANRIAAAQVHATLALSAPDRFPQPPRGREADAVTNTGGGAA